MTILIVDDTHMDIMVASAMLAPFGDHGTIAFEDPVTALTWCATNRPHLVMLDYYMPRLNGLDFIRYMRALPNCGNVPIIMATSGEPDAIAEETREAGVSSVLGKPFEAHEFSRQVKSALALAGHCR